MKFELASYKSGRSKEALVKTEVTIEELEYLYGLVDRELTMSDALYGFAGGTRKERSLMKKMGSPKHVMLAGVGCSRI